jgi:hypothetical protein
MYLNLEELYLLALFKFQIKQYPEMVSLLGIAEKLIKLFWSISKSPKFLNTAQKVDLFISNLFISDRDYISADIYQERVFKLAYKELFLRINKDDGFNYENSPIGMRHQYNKIFLNLIKAFYQRGISEENKGNLFEAANSYKQANYFLNNFQLQNPELSQYLTDLFLRANSCHFLLKKIRYRFYNQDQQYQYQNNLLIQNNINQIIIQDKEIEKEKDYNTIRLIKPGKLMAEIKEEKNQIKNKKKLIIEKNKNEKNDNEELKEIINGLKFQEFEFIEDDKKSNTINKIMSTRNLLNNLSSKKFKNIIKDASEFGIEKFNSELFEKIQKRLNEIRTEKKLAEMEKNKNSNKNEDKFTIKKDTKKEIVKYLQKGKIIENKLQNFGIDFNKKIKISNQKPSNSESLSTDKLTQPSSPLRKSTKLNYKLFSDRKTSSQSQNEYLNSNSNTNSNRNTNTNINPNINANKNGNKKERYFSYDNGFGIRTSYGNTNPNTNTERSSKDFYSTSYSKIKKENSSSIKKYNHDEYIFSNKFQNKLQKIDKFMNKEYDFQKELLHLKRIEKVPIDIKEINENELKIEAKKFFDITKLKSELGLFKDKPKIKQTNLDKEKNKKIKIKQKIEKTLIQSCDVKILSIFNKIKKDEERNENLIRNEFLDKEKVKNLSHEEMEKLKLEFEKNIEKDLNFIEKKKKICKKIIDDDNKLLKDYLYNHNQGRNEEKFIDNINIFSVRNKINKNFNLDDFVYFDKSKKEKDLNFSLDKYEDKY